LSRRFALSRQPGCHDASARCDLLVAVALPVALLSRWLRRARQDLACLGWFHGHIWGVGLCPRAGCPLDLLVRNAAGWVAAFSDRSFSGRAVCAGVGRRPFWRLFPEGEPCVPVVTVTWDPYPRALVSEGVAPGGGRARVRSRVADSEQRGKWWNSSVSHLKSSLGWSGSPRWLSLAVSRFLGFCRLASWAMFSGFYFLRVLSGCLRCSSQTLWRVWGPGWFCLWALNLVELFLPDLVEVRDVGACVVRLWSLVVAPVFRELLCLGGCVPRVCFRIVLLWPDPSCGSWHYSSCFFPATLAGKGLIRGWRHDLRGSLERVREVGSLDTREIPKAENNERLEKVMRGFAICLAGVLLFPSIDNTLEEDQLSSVCGIWKDERLGLAVLAFLYSRLTDVARIIGLQVDGEAVTGVTYADYTEFAQGLLGLELAREDDLGDPRMVDRVELLES
ncbi:hypothetical protein Taro_013687, partial [Colocasia esculenta]|nr:hypothetical protein [Colocasia esculenta]